MYYDLTRDRVGKGDSLFVDGILYTIVTLGNNQIIGVSKDKTKKVPYDKAVVVKASQERSNREAPVGEEAVFEISNLEDCLNSGPQSFT